MPTNSQGLPWALWHTLHNPPEYPDSRGYSHGKNGRVSFRVPVKVYAAPQAAEYALTENLSKGGFCFLSGCEYRVGQDLLVEILCGDTGQEIQAHARVVWRKPSGTSSSRYGMQYILNTPSPSSGR